MTVLIERDLSQFYSKLIYSVFIFLSVTMLLILLIISLCCIVSFLFTKTHFSRCYLDLMSFLLRACSVLKLLNSFNNKNNKVIEAYDDIFHTELLLFFSPLLYIIVFRCSAVPGVFFLLNKAL